MARRVGVPPPPTHTHTHTHTASPSSCAKALPHFASYIMEQRKFSLPSLPYSIGLSLYFLLHPLKAKRLFFPSFWRWYNFTWSPYNAHSQPTPPSPLSHIFSSIHPHPLLFRFWLDEAILWIQHRTLLFFSVFCFILFSFLLKRFCAV